MNFRKLKGLSPAQKIYACIAIIAVFLVGTFLHLHILSTSLSESIAREDLAAKLLQKAQTIPFNGELILREVPKAKDELERNINMYEKHFYTLKAGGTLYYDGVVSALTASSDDSNEIFQELETVWFEYKANSEILLNQETFIGGSEIATGTMDEFGNYVAEEVFKSVSPEVRNAIVFLEANSERFIKLNTKIVDTYETEVMLFIRAKTIAMYVDFSILAILFIILALLFRTVYFVNISKLRQAAQEVAAGNLDAEIDDSTSGEFGQIWESFGQVISTFKTAVRFIERIGRGDLDVEYELKSEDDDFGRSLVQMKAAMIAASEEEKHRKIEDDIRSWTTHGIAKFGELLRQNSTNLDELSYSVISELIEYVGANQGGVFILEEEEVDGKYFMLSASYAYNRRKYLQKKIAWGDTLVGRCALEKKTLYIKEVPEDYLEISSGLGNYRPASLLLCPLKYNDEIYGVIELASFSELLPHHISFVEKISESIASTISSVRINSRTSKLLEESKEQAELLSQQEEEMRQNMEEMQATQEEASIRTGQLEGIIHAIDNTLGTFELDLDGKFINANSNYIRTLRTEIDTLLIQHHRDVIAQFAENINDYDDFFQDLVEGGTVKRVFQYQLDSDTIYLQESFTPIYDIYDSVSKIIVFTTNVTEDRHNQIMAQQSLARIQEQELQMNENIEKLQDAQHTLEERDERQAKLIAQLSADNEAKMSMLKMREEINLAVINSNPEGVIVFNKRGDVTVYNNALQQILHIHDIELKSVFEVLKNIGDVAAIATEFQSPGKNYYYITNDNQEIPVHVSVIYNKVGLQHVYIGFVRDLANSNKTQEQKDAILGQALAREFELKAEIDRLRMGINSDSSKNQAINPFEWRDEYNTGYNEIDIQHRKLLAILKELHQAFKEGKAFIQMQKIFNELIEYTQIHFSFEESKLAMNSYHDYDAHIAKHHKLVEAVKEYEAKFRSGDLGVSHEMIEFLRSWLMTHIMTEDKAYVGHLTTGWGQSQAVSSSLNESSVSDAPASMEPALSVRLKWDDKYTTGIAELDTQSKDWIEFMEIIYTKYDDKSPRKELNALFVEMQALLKSYFRLIESRSTEYAFDDNTELLASHRAITDNLTKLLILVESGEGNSEQAIDIFANSLIAYLNGVHAQLASFMVKSKLPAHSKITTEETEESFNDDSIEWSDSIAIGLSTIDDQHKILLDLVSQLQSAVRENRTKKQIKTLLKGAVDYSEYHFGVEERNFAQFKYADASDHTSVHKTLLSEVKLLQEEFNAKPNENISLVKIASFATNLIRHFTEDDRKYVPLFKEKGIK